MLRGVLRELDRVLAKHGRITGEEAFKLRESRGLPLEICQEIVAPRGIVIDVEGYEKALQAHKLASMRHHVTEC